MGQMLHHPPSVDGDSAGSGLTDLEMAPDLDQGLDANRVWFGDGQVSLGR